MAQLEDEKPTLLLKIEISWSMGQRSTSTPSSKSTLALICDTKIQALQPVAVREVNGNNSMWIRWQMALARQKGGY